MLAALGEREDFGREGGREGRRVAAVADPPPKTSHMEGQTSANQYAVQLVPAYDVVPYMQQKTTNVGTSRTVLCVYVYCTWCLGTVHVSLARDRNRPVLVLLEEGALLCRT